MKFELWEETGVAKENTARHIEDMQTHKAQSGTFLLWGMLNNYISDNKNGNIFTVKQSKPVGIMQHKKINDWPTVKASLMKVPDH